MCGFIGGTNTEWDYHQAIQAIAHRGPDNQQVGGDADVPMAFARLAVMDTRDVANQPMSDSDEQVWMVFNGEVYGHQRLRATLASNGYVFKTHSDSEVVLNAYLHWGDSFVDHIDGMFAICFYDKRCGRLKLYRDRSGIKPLYYYWDGEYFGFASELKSLSVAVGEGSLSVDSTAIYDFLTYRYVPSPKTIYRNLYKLPSAHVLEFDLSKKTIVSDRSYWSLDRELCGKWNGTVGEAAEQLESLLGSAIQDQLVADVPVGCFLSGGIDSSCIVDHASRLTDQLNTFTIGFHDSPRDESAFAQQVASHFGTDHQLRQFSLDAIDEKVEAMSRWFDEPFLDLSALPTYMVCGVARETATVALSGDGGDELFGGYTWYNDVPRWQRLSGRLPSRFSALFQSVRKRMPSGLIGGKLQAACRLGQIASEETLGLLTLILSGWTPALKRDFRRRLQIPEDYDDYWFYRLHDHPELPIKTRLQWIDFHTYLPEDLLTKVDRTSMQHSLEVRVPFLDRQLIEFAFSLPEEIKFYQGQLKGLLRYTYRDSLPNEITRRGKQGFSIPGDQSRRLQRSSLDSIASHWIAVSETSGGELSV